MTLLVFPSHVHLPQMAAPEFIYSRWVKNDYELVRWPPDAEKDRAAGIFVAGEEEKTATTPDAAQARVAKTVPSRRVLDTSYAGHVVG